MVDLLVIYLLKSAHISGDFDLAEQGSREVALLQENSHVCVHENLQRKISIYIVALSPIPHPYTCDNL